MTVPARQTIRRQAVSIALAVIPFGIAFGVACAQAGLGVAEAAGFSTLVFTGGSQFAAVRVLADGGTAAAALGAGLLLSIRSLAYGVVMTPAFADKPRWWRALAAQWMIDETMAIGSAQRDPADQRYGYLLTGALLFTTWNISTIAGTFVSEAGDLVTRYGIDATIPAAFLALVWPRLRDPAQRPVIAGGVVISLLLVPFAPPGIPIVAAAAAIVVSGGRRPRSASHPSLGGAR